MKILITTGIFQPEVGGPATFAVEFAKRLSASGYTVEIITYSDTVTHHTDAEHTFFVKRIVRTKSKLSNYIRYFVHVFNRSGSCDLIYSLDWFSAGVPVMFAAALRRKKYVVRVGGGYIWEKYLAEGRPPVTLRQFYELGLHEEYKVMFFFIKTVLRRAVAVVFNSEEQKNIYREYYNLTSSHVFVIQNAVSSHVIGSLIQNFNIKNREKDREIIFAGRFIKMKNLETLVEAFARIKDRLFKLVLIGDGPTEGVIHNLVREHALSDRVEFLPKLSQMELYKRISNCYVFVLPSWTDVSPHQVYECLALGIPVLLTKENYLNLPIPKKYLIDPTSADDIAAKIDMLADEKNYREFSRTLLSIKVERSWDMVVEEHKTLFNSVV